MKPVFQEDHISKLKSIIDNVMNPGREDHDVSDLVDEIETSLKSQNDNKENKIFLYGASGLVIIFALILMYTTKASWPLMFIVVWLGGLMYYRVHEKSLITTNLQLKSLISPTDSVPKIDYLLSAIDLKIGRKEVLKYFLSIMLSSTVMMAHRLFVDSSVTLNMFLLIGAIIASYFFWNNFYKEDINMMQDIRDQLNQLKSKIVLNVK